MPFTTTWVSDQCYLVSLMMMHSGLGSEIIKKKKKSSAFLFQPLLLAHWQLSTNEILSCPLGSILNASIEFFKWSLVLFQELKKTYWSLVFCSWLTDVFKCALVFGCVPLTRNGDKVFKVLSTFFSPLHNIDFWQHELNFLIVKFNPLQKTKKIMTFIFGDVNSTT